MNNLTTTQGNTIAQRRPLGGVIQESLNNRTMPEIGRLGMGIKVESSKGTPYPKDVDYFVLRDDAGPYAKRFKEVYGTKPKELKVFFMEEDITQFYDQAFRLWGGNGRLKCISYNGETAMQADSNGLKSEVLCPQLAVINHFEPSCECPLRLNDKGQAVCKLQLRLSFCLTEVAPLNGVFSLYTGSRVGQADMFVDLNHIRMVAGKLAHVPLVLFRQEKKIKQPDGKMATHWPLRIRFSDEVTEALTTRYNDELTFRMGRVIGPSPAIAATLPAQAPPVAQIAAPVDVIDVEPEPQTVDYTAFILSALTSNKEAVMRGGASENEASEMVLIKFCSYLTDSFQVSIAKVEGIAALSEEIKSTIADQITDAANAGEYPWTNH